MTPFDSENACSLFFAMKRSFLFQKGPPELLPKQKVVRPDPDEVRWFSDRCRIAKMQQLSRSIHWDIEWLQELADKLLYSTSGQHHFMLAFSTRETQQEKRSSARRHRST